MILTLCNKEALSSTEEVLGKRNPLLTSSPKTIPTPTPFPFQADELFLIISQY